MDSSAALETRIREKIVKLEKIYPIISGEIKVQAINNKQQQGRLFTVHIDIRVPGGEVVVSHRPGAAKKIKRHEEIYAAMNDAFLAIEKQLRHFKDIQKNEKRLHKPILKPGTVTVLNKKEKFGYIEAADGESIYFHANCVQAERFNELKVGRRVRFSVVEGEGRKGPQANVVRARALPKPK
jgi:ribosomal subunit interface protein